jgi:hypothetical protein
MVVIGILRIVKSMGPIAVKVKHNENKSTACVKSLGLYSDSQLNWAQRIGSVTKNCNSILWSLYPIQRMVTQANRKLVMGVLSKLWYMCHIWGTSKKTCIKKLEGILRSTGRYVLNSQKYDKVKYEMSGQLGWLFPDYMDQNLIFNF